MSMGLFIEKKRCQYYVIPFCLSANTFVWTAFFAVNFNKVDFKVGNICILPPLLTRKIKADRLIFQSSKAGNCWAEVHITLKTKFIISVRRQKIVTGRD